MEEYRRLLDGILRWILKKLVVSYAMLLWRRYGRIQEAL